MHHFGSFVGCCRVPWTTSRVAANYSRIQRPTLSVVLQGTTSAAVRIVSIFVILGRKSTFRIVGCAETEDDRKSWTHTLAHSPNRLEGKSRAVRERPAVFVLAAVR